jgi:citrate lyase subunit beta / citryl-CoA lyase
MKANLRRSVLYVPGDSEKMLQKAAGIESDVLLLNLEDGVAASRKEAARKNVAEALKKVNFGSRELVVRVNSLNSVTGTDDLAAVVPCRPDGICLPKIESAAEIAAAASAILDLETGHGLTPGGIRIHAMIESAAGLLHSPEVAAASPRMASLIFGSADYAADVRCQPGEDRAEITLALQMIVNAARSGGIDAVDAPCFDLRNRDLLERESIQARRIGFDGKSVLHPDQLEVINRIFDVTSDEIAWAEKVLTELDEAENRGKALTTLNGVLLDNPHRAAAQRILSRKKLR